MIKRWRSKEISLPKARTLHGIKIEKVPVGRYISAMQEIQDLPSTIIDRCFPDHKSLQAVIDRARNSEGEVAFDMIGSLLKEAPQVIVELAAVFLDTPEETLMALTPTQLLDVLENWWELNDLTGFFSRVWKKAKPTLERYQARPTPGSKSGSQ